MWKALLFLFFLASFNSCIVVNSLLGLERCNYAGCERQCVENCNYCIIHCESYNVPEDLETKTDKAIEKQIKRYKSNPKSDWGLD